MNLRNDDSTAHDNRQASRSEVPAGTGQTAYKRELAYRRLGINPKDVPCVPFLAVQLRRIARTVRGASADDPAAAAVRPLEYLRNNDTKHNEGRKTVSEVIENMVGPCGLEPQTSTVSRWRSSQLSYGPITTGSLAQQAAPQT